MFLLARKQERNRLSRLQVSSVQPRRGRTPLETRAYAKRKMKPFIGALYALTTAALRAAQAPLSFLAAKQLSVAQFIVVTELVLLLCVPFMIRTRRSREHFVTLVSSASNLGKFGVLLLIGLIGIVLYAFGLGRGASDRHRCSPQSRSFLGGGHCLSHRG